MSVSVGAQRITVDGTPRRFLLAEPPGQPRGVVLCLHGTRSTASGQVRLSRMAELVRSAGVLVAFPEAVTRVGSGFEWDQDADVAYLLQLVGDLVGRSPVPGGRVCVTGMSGGARMSCHLASTHPDVVGTVGAVAGLRAPERGVMEPPVPVVAFHGTRDRINPYQGSGTRRWDEGVPDAARRWALANGVTTEPTTVELSADLARTTYGSDGGPGEVTLWTARGAGHTWPGARLGLFLRLFLGPTTTEVDATAEIWRFVQRHGAGA